MSEENKNTEPEQPAENNPKEIIPSEEIIMPVTEIGASKQPQTTTKENILSETETPAPEIINPPQAKEMEVHHHGHVHEKKKWKEYLFQFLMLFLAVFCGFLAEYQLEHLIEKQKGRQYISSFLQDLEIDNKQLDQLIPAFIEKDKLLDTLLQKIRGISPSTGANGIYKYYRQTFAYPDFIYTDRTMQQLKNSGGLRLIAKAASDSIITYDAEVRLSSIGISEGVKDLRVPIMLMTFKLFDLRCCPELGTVANDLRTPSIVTQINYPEPGILLTYDSRIITEYFNAVQEIKRQYAIYLKDLQALKKYNIRVRDYLQKEYRPNN